MDINAALAMEANAMKKMKKQASPTESTSDSTASGEMDLISFNESFVSTNATAISATAKSDFSSFQNLSSSSMSNRSFPMKKENGMLHGINTLHSRNTLEQRSTISIGNPFASNAYNSLPFHTSAETYSHQPWNTHRYERNFMVSRYKESVLPPETLTFNRWYSNNNTLPSLQKPANNTAMLSVPSETSKKSSVPDFTSAFAEQKNLSSEDLKSQGEEMNNIFEQWLNESTDSQEKSPEMKETENESLILFSMWKELDPLHSDNEEVKTKSISDATLKISPDMKKVQTTENFGGDRRESPVRSPTKENVGQTAIEKFIDSMTLVHKTFPHNDPVSNAGYLVSPKIPKWQQASEKTTVNIKVSITVQEVTDPFVFTCSVDALIEHVVSQALCIAFEDISQLIASDYILKIAGKQEYLLNGSTLRCYEIIQECVKFDEDLKLQLMHCKTIDRSLNREPSDNLTETIAEKLTKALHDSKKSPISSENVQIVNDAFVSEIDKLLGQEIVNSNLTWDQQCRRIVQSVKAICQLLNGFETTELTNSIMHFQKTVEEVKSSLLVPCTPMVAIDKSIKLLKTAVGKLIQLYRKAMSLNMNCGMTTEKHQIPVALSSTVHDLLSVNVVSAHRLPVMWATMYQKYYISCQLFYGNQPLCEAITTDVNEPSLKESSAPSQPKIIWNNWFNFPVRISDLPRETKLYLVMCGYPAYSETSKSEKINIKELCWVNVPLFDHNSFLQQSGCLYGMWSASDVTASLRTSSSCSCNIVNPDSVIVHLLLMSEEESMNIKFPSFSSPRNILRKRKSNESSSSRLTEGTKKELYHILGKNPFLELSAQDKELIWKHRNSTECSNHTGSLVRILSCLESWAPRNLRPIYELLDSWPWMQPIEALQLLSVSVPDKLIREWAVGWIQLGEEGEIHEYLVQLVQALKYEMFHASTLAQFLIRQSLGSIRITHKLYWILQENSNDGFSGERYSLMLRVLLSFCGAKLKKEFEKEDYLVKIINRVAEFVKYAKENARSSVLKNELGRVAARVQNHSFHLPTNSSLLCRGLNVEESSYFTSNAIPLKLSFINKESVPKHIDLMYKVGDDLRQDVLTMQLVKMMDKLWLSEGLDLKIITFTCLATGKDKGFIELVSDSITLRDIQASYGLTGAFKDRPIYEWLQKYNTTRIEYEKAEENFTLSLAGYCVATYVLGICDRHNDNIMLCQSGHLFHIDFSKFLGHAQMFGNIKRDRAPFVLTSDMAFVINGGDRPSSNFHDFVDICCEAFNIIRKHAHIFMNLLSLMIHSGIPELKNTCDLKYIYDALKPAASDSEATAMFTRLIEASLSSSFTRINFFIHNLAQLRFHGGSSENKKSLSFTFKTYTQEDDGILTSAVIVGYQKRYDPAKEYVYCVRLTRELRSAKSYVFRTFDEFAELHEKLELSFSAWKLPSFPNKIIVGRSQIKQVAERRMNQLNVYLNSLLHTHQEVYTNNLIYTFFHPLLRDEQGSLQPKDQTAKKSIMSNQVGGEIKLSIHHKNNALFIMVMHCRNLMSPDGNDPDPYVKTYLLSDPNRATKRKTKVAKKTSHPTYNEMIVYNLPLQEVSKRILHVSVWNYETLNENDFMGGVQIHLEKIDLRKEVVAWYPLQSITL